MLLTVSGWIPEELDRLVESGQRPRADYVVLGQRLDADVVDVRRALASSGLIGRLLLRLGGAGGLLAYYCVRHRSRYEVILTDGEQVGLPYAMWCRLVGRRRTAHVMIVHILSTPTKSRLVRLFRLGPLIDKYIVYSSRQGQLLIEDLGVSADRVSVIPFMVDTQFFVPPRQGGAGRLICSAGLERRDYATLVEAVEGVDAEVVIAAASPWSRQSDKSSTLAVPDNVRFCSLDLAELRDLYASAAFVVMPLVEVDFQAGITSILEAMAMARPVLCSRTAGQTDTIMDGETGWYVTPGDPAALRSKIVDLLDDSAEVERIGAAARQWVVQHADIEVYADRIAEVAAAATVEDHRTKRRL